MRFLRLPFIALALAAIIGFLVYRPDIAASQGTSLWPQGTAFTLNSTASQQVITSNPTRRAIQICNVSTPTNLIIWIAPSPITAAANTGGSIPLVSLSAASTSTANCYITPNSAPGSQGNAWNAISPTTTPAALTILEY